MDTQFITKDDLVKATKTSLPTINRRIKDGTIPAVKMGTRVLIPASYLTVLEEQAKALQGQGV